MDVFLSWSGGVFVVVWWCFFCVCVLCFCGGVEVFLWWCGMFLWWCGVFVVL